MPKGERSIYRSPLVFFIAVMLASLPFWVVGQTTWWTILPGVPLSALMVLVPGLVAFAFVARATGVSAAVQWLATALRPSALKRVGWLLIALLMPSALLVAAYVAMLASGLQLPNPQISFVSAAVLLATFFIPAVFEEVGWSGFALVALQRRMSALNASLVIGAIWAAWHFIPLLQVERSVAWIGWWSVTTVALRILITWIFNNAGESVLLAALFHASENASWQSFPIRGSHYDPAVHAVVLALVCCVVVAVFGSRTLTRRTE